ncbi:MAG TPA: hypothetical protein V6D08_04815, partial [Candidatus Obscuribacterales bacterium]
MKPRRRFLVVIAALTLFLAFASGSCQARQSWSQSDSLPRSRQEIDSLIQEAMSSKRGQERLKAIVESHRQSWESHLLLGAYYARLGWKSMAAQEFLKSGELAEGDPEALFAVLCSRLSTLDLGEAGRLAEKAHRLYPKDRRFLVFHIIFLEAQNKHDRAEALRRQAAAGGSGDAYLACLG